MERLKKLGRNKIQIIFAGKAHPKDKNGKKIIQSVVKNANALLGDVKVIFLENYNMWLGRLITSGVDIWLNTPLRPNEASGTSGMKAALNGVPNLSILDGWWAEGCEHGVNGWAIGEPEFCDDKADADSLYQILEQEVIPTYYNDKKKWTNLMRASIEKSIQFTAHRMIAEYEEKFYSKIEEPSIEAV
jgi:starch phosphorylase